MHYGLLTSYPAVRVYYEAFLDEINHFSLLNSDRLISFLKHNLFKAKVVESFDFVKTAIRAFDNFELTRRLIYLK